METNSFFQPEAKLADPICTFLFSFLVLCTTFSILKDSAYILMEGFPKNIEYSMLQNVLQSIEGVRMVHSLHVWSLTVSKNALAVHLAIGK